ncbi:ARK protein kinase family, partial [Moesziomyces antarcticus T-34]
MAARKLQTEIDKTLKKVGEGVEIFEDMYELLQRSTNSTQKEKMESDLKTQIKKLQRLRDQIKTWLQSNDIKDKKPLLDNRKLIETQMEKFKAIEKEMKTKAFSKEGLIAAAKMNPRDREKAEISDWLSTQVDELARQTEAAEAEIETISGSGKKKKGSAKDERASQLENANDRRNWHMSRLEILLRMLENGNLDTERVQDIKEDIAYFVESNMEEDFEEDEGIYDDLNLDDGEEAFGLKENDDLHSNHDSTAGMDDLSFRDLKDTPTKQRRDSLADTHTSTTSTNKDTAILTTSSSTSNTKDKDSGSSSHAKKEDAAAAA